jgi:hypothetical protein
MTTPGVGPVVSLTYRAAVDVPARFGKRPEVLIELLGAFVFSLIEWSEHGR